MKIIKSITEYISFIGLFQDSSATFKEENVNDVDVKPFSNHEIELYKKWHDMWQYAWDNEIDGWELKKTMKEEFGNDFLDYILRFEYLVDEYGYEPEDFSLLSNNTIQVAGRILKNLELEFLKTENQNQSDVRITEYIIEFL